MAIHFAAEIVPGKLELLQAWVPNQPWLGGADASTLTPLGSFRFDDPDGEVGIETHLLSTADGRVLQVPVDLSGSATDVRRSVLDHHDDPHRARRPMGLRRLL
jgi:hypothetical protein